MPKSALCQQNTTLLCHRHKLLSCRNFRGSPISLCRLQAFSTRPRDCHRSRLQVLVYSCAKSADQTSISQCLDGDVLTPDGGLKTSQQAKHGRPILSGGGGGIFFFWQLGRHLSLPHDFALAPPAALSLYSMPIIQGMIFECICLIQYLQEHCGPSRARCLECRCHQVLATTL